MQSFESTRVGIAMTSDPLAETSVEGRCDAGAHAPAEKSVGGVALGEPRVP